MTKSGLIKSLNLLDKKSLQQIIIDIYGKYVGFEKIVEGKRTEPIKTGEK